MKCIIHGTATDGSEDSVEITADTVEELQEKAMIEIEVRCWDEPWSECV